MTRRLSRLSLTMLVSLAGSVFAGDAKSSVPSREALRDPAPEVRLRAALVLAKQNDADAIPVLIDLLAVLPRERREAAEALLRQLAGEWVPLDGSLGEDEISRRIRRDAWAAWWRAAEGKALLDEIRKHTPAAGTQEKIRGLLARLDADHFADREAAFAELRKLGRAALPQLQETAKRGGRRAAREAEILIERIERDPVQPLPLAALRLLSLRKPRGGAEAVLAYLAACEEDTHSAEARKTLAVLALRGGKPEPALLRALADARPEIRASAAEALVQGGGAMGRDAVRERLRADTPAIRLRIALALARKGEREGVAVTIDLLTVLSEEEAALAEESLNLLAGDTAPDLPSGSGAAARKKYRDAWAAWWKLNANRVDYARLTDQPWYGYTLVCAYNQGRVYEIDRHGKERWAITGLSGPVDACMVRGNRVLIAEWNGNRVTERDLTGKIVWEKRLNLPISVQRLRNGNTFVADRGNAAIEYDRTGKQAYRIPSVPGGLLAAYRARDGTIVCTNGQGECLLYDATGKQLKRFATGQDANSNGGLDLMSNGHLLISRREQGKVAEYDRAGKLVRELAAPGVTTATALRNGRLLIASYTQSRLYEMDRAGKIVWEHKNPGNAFRARRR